MSAFRVSSSCFCCEAPFTNKEHTCKQSHRVHYSSGTMDTASTNGVPIMCPILRLPKSSTRRHFSDHYAGWSETFRLLSDFENFDFQSILVLLSKQPKNAVLVSRVPFRLPSQFTRRWDLRNHNHHNRNSSNRQPNTPAARHRRQIQYQTN